MFRIIITCFCCALAGAVFFFYTRPAYDGVVVLQKTIGEYDLALDKANELQKLRQSLLTRYNTFDPADVDRLNKLLPDHVDNVRLILDLDTLASRFGLALQNVVIDSNVAAAAGSKGVAAPIGGNARVHDSLSFRFSTQGSYASFVTFMEELEMSLRIVDVVTLAITPVATGETALLEPLFRFDVVVRTYWLK